MATNLVCGYLGIMEQIEPRPPLQGVGYKAGHNLPTELGRALDALRDCRKLHEMMGERFTQAYLAAKRTEYTAYLGVISSWERQYLLLRV